MRDVSVIILNHNGREWLPGCIEAVLAQQEPAAEIVVVDNASQDGSASFVRARYPQARVVELSLNRGFAGGNNAGARAASAAYLAFLNNDTVTDSRWLQALRAPLARDPSVGLTTSRIVYLDNPAVVDSAGDGYLRAGGAFKRLHGQPTALANEPREVFGACGAAFMIRRDVFERLGGFDEDFFMVYEDVDLSYRARLAGFRCLYVADAVVRHAGSATLGRASAPAVFYGQRNLEWTYLKNTPWPLLVRSLPSHAAYVAAAGGRYALAGLLGAYLRGKLSALAGLGRVLRQRRALQRGRRVPAAALWRAMDRGWIAVKRREKRFELDAG